MDDIELVIRRNDLRAAVDGDILTAEQLADGLIESMAERVKVIRQR
jgi:hypothetical protein